MTIKKSLLVLPAALLVTALVSCKEDEEVSLPSLDGALRVTGVPSYVKVGDDTEYKMTPSGVIHPGGGEVGYRWKVEPPDDAEYTVTREENGDGDGSFTYDFSEYNKDTLRTLTVTCEAFAEGYASLSGPVAVTIVNSGRNGSIQRAGYDFDGTKTVYDGIEYLTYTAPDGRTWMKQNLAYDGQDSDTRIGAPFDDSEAMSDIFGRFYTWNEAADGTVPSGQHVRGICPEGWHLPSDEEWTALANATMRNIYPDWEDMSAENDWSRDDYKISKEFMAGEMLNPDTPETDEDYDSDIEYGKEARSATFNNETILWEYYSEVGDPTNRSGISAIPSGYARRTNSLWSFDGEYEYAIFWTSDEDPHDSSKAICRVINCESNIVYRESHDKQSFAASVRCVRD